MIYESGRMKVIENILDEVKKHKNDNGEVECYPSYDQEALKLVDDGHVDWLYERVKEMEELTHTQGKVILKQNDKLDIFDQQNKRYRELLEKIKEMTRYDDCREAEIYELVSDELEGEE